MDDRTRPPGIAMMIAAGVFAVLTVGFTALYGGIMGLAAVAEPPGSGQPPDTMALVGVITVIIVMGLLFALLYGFIGWGGFNLMNRRSYAFAMTGAVLYLIAGIPCSCIPINSFVFIPIGIWSLTVLMDPSIKDNWYAPSVPAYIAPSPPGPLIPPSS